MTAVIPDMAIADPRLTVWRSELPWSATATARRVQGAVAEALWLMRRQDLVERIMSCEVDACLHAMPLVPRSASSEWVQSCLWLVLRYGRGSGHAPYAAFALATALAEEAAYAISVGAVDDDPVVRSLIDKSIRLLALAGFHWHDRARLVEQLATDKPLPHSIKRLPRQRTVTGDDRSPSSRLVLPEGIPEGASDSKRLRERFAALLEPLPVVPLPEPDAVESALLVEAPWLSAATERVVGDLRLARMLGSRELRIRPLMLVGPPGVGKSRWVRRLAALVGAPFGVVAAGGSSDSRSLAGTASGWSSAQPSYPAMLLATRKHANAMILVDEIDKAGGSDRNGRLVDTLLSMVEPETARRWPDECLCSPVDLGGICWVATANEVSGLPAALLDRFGIVECGRPGPEAFDAVLDGVLADLADEFGAGRAAGRTLRGLIEPEALEEMVSVWTETASPRRLRGIVSAVLAAVARDAGRH